MSCHIWKNASVELDRYLNLEDRGATVTGTGTGCDEPPIPLPRLGPGIALYDTTLAWIKVAWGNYDGMPAEGLRTWNIVLAVSRRGGDKDKALAQWAKWLQSKEGRTEVSETVAQPRRDILESVCSPWEDVSGRKQRTLLRLLHGHGAVPIAKALQVLYSSTLETNLPALERLISRTNKTLADRNDKCEISRRGNTLILRSST